MERQKYKRRVEEENRRIPSEVVVLWKYNMVSVNIQVYLIIDNWNANTTHTEAKESDRVHTAADTSQISFKRE